MLQLQNRLRILDRLPETPHDDRAEKATALSYNLFRKDAAFPKFRQRRHPSCLSNGRERGGFLPISFIRPNKVPGPVTED